MCCSTARGEQQAVNMHFGFEVEALGIIGSALAERIAHLIFRNLSNPHALVHNMQLKQRALYLNFSQRQKMGFWQGLGGVWARSI